jgi:hypothetical protein
MNSKDPWLPRMALIALAINATLSLVGSTDLQMHGIPVPAFFERSGMVSVGTLIFVATSGRNRPPLI